jgi:serine/threonine protein kinase/tetratricopeptide (TPR) repeat protein
MIRCPQCGLRIPDAQPACPTHGTVASEPGHEAEPRASTGEPELEAAFATLGYRITTLLGRGGFGAVYAAERVQDGSPVAIKLGLRDQPDATDSLTREVAALRAVGPPHVPEVYESGELPEGFYIVMERIDAPTLADRMVALAGEASLATFGALAHAIMTPLEAVHAAGIVHRDLKPENIFIYDTGIARLIDFGLAKPQGAGAENLERTLAADDVGTAEYMSPEQCDGDPNSDRSSDLYSLGTLFYELLSGAPPFWGRAADVREAHRSRRPAPLKTPCPPELDQLVRRCLAKDPQRRFDDIPSLRSALEASLIARVPTPPPAPPPPKPGSTAPKRAAPTPSAAREKRAMGLVFFESKAGVGGVQSVVTAAGGQIVQTNGSQYVAAFGHDVGDNPARVALVAAHRLLASKLSQRLLVDVATVSVQNRPDGSRRIFSAVLSKNDRFPTANDPIGVMFTSAAFEVLPDLESNPLEGRPDRFVLAFQQNASELTTFGIQLSPLVGREELLDSLIESARHAAIEAQPTLFTVLGANGYGRTHLASVTAHELGRSAHGIEVIRLTAQESVMSAVSQVLPELLRRLLDLPREPPEQGGKALLLSRLGEGGEGVWAAAAHALGWIDAEHPEVRRLASAPGALRLASARAAGDALRRRAEKKPIALLLDDAQLADEATLDALEYATLKDVPARIWVCVLARPSFAGSRPGWGSRAAISHRIVLTELSPQHAVELARRLLLPAEYIPEAVLLRLAERTQGVPRLLVELVRGLKRDGFVRRAERGTGYYLAIDELDKLPDLPIVQWNAIREIEALPTQLAGHARLASVLGASFTTSEVEALLQVLEREEIPEDMHLDASVGVQRLIESGILVRHRNGQVNFRHALLRDTIYQLLPEAQRARLHRAAFEAYRALAMPDDQRLPRLAMHAARCGEREVAASAYLKLALRFMRVQAYLEAEGAYGSALDNLAEDDERTIDAARGRGLMRSRLGRQDGALQDLRRARESAHARAATEREIELMLDEATVLDWTREANQSTALVRAVEAMEVPLSPLLEARLAMGLARSHHRQGEAEATVRVGSEAVRLAEALGDEGYETRIIAQLMVATDCANSGRLEQAERSFEEVITEAASRGDLWHVAAAFGNRAVLWHGLKDVERLFADLARTVQLGREIGEASMEFVAVYNLAESEYVLGRLGPAREHARRGLELSKQLFGDINREVSVSELLLARIALYDDDLGVARELACNIRERTARGLAAGEREAELEPPLQLLLEMIELGADKAPLTAWQALVERSRTLELQPMEEVELLERAAIASASLGAVDGGRSLYEQAQEVSERKPNLMSERIARKLAPLFGESARA